MDEAKDGRNLSSLEPKKGKHSWTATSKSPAHCPIETMDSSMAKDTVMVGFLIRPHFIPLNRRIGT